MFGQKCIARNSPVAICASKQSPSNDPKFHQPLIVDGVGRSIPHENYEECEVGMRSLLF